MPYVERNKWVCWNCVGARCSLCINRQVRAADPSMQLCDCTHNITPAWLVDADKRAHLTAPVSVEHHSPHTGPIPVIVQPRTYTEPWWTRRVGV